MWGRGIASSGSRAHYGGRHDAPKGRWEDSSEVENGRPFAERLEHFFNKLQMGGVDLISFLGGLIRENDIQTHLVRLIHHRPMAGDHPADVEVNDARQIFQILVATRNQLVGRIGRSIRFDPKNNNVAEHMMQNLQTGSGRKRPVG